MSDTLHVGTRKGMFTITRRANGRWDIGAPQFAGAQVPMLLHDRRDGRLYAALAHGHFGSKLHRSTDLGATWDEVACPTYPPKPDDAPDIMCPMRNIPVPWSLELLWSLEPGGADQPGRLYAGTIPGGLFVSDDYGDTWRLNEPLWNEPARAKWAGGGYDFPGIHSIHVDPRNADRIVAAVSCGGVWISEDAGATWNNRAQGMRAEYTPPEQAYDMDIQDPHRLVACAAQPDCMWVQHHNGIFRTTDGAASWQEVENVAPSTFGFGVAVHPTDPDTAWFAPAASDELRLPVDGKLVITRTTDGGKTFEPLTDGLPQTDAYDLIYRHALEVDDTGQRLVCGSTTGSLWVSENGGERWEAISHHLPPIFCTRFA